MRRPLMTLVALAGLVSCLGASAQPDERHRDGPYGPHLRFDDRYHHDHYYPPRGEAIAVLPGGAIGVGYRGGNWFFHGGVWFRPAGGRYIVDLPPVGIVAPQLPPDYATLSIGGAPYYYANGTYYAPGPGNGYVVVDPPPGADMAEPMTSQPGPSMAPPPQSYATAPAPVPAAAPAPRGLPEPIYYPRNGQSTDQTETDRQGCNRWATTQSGAMADASVFQRAASACMDGRGYTVR